MNAFPNHRDPVGTASSISNTGIVLVDNAKERIVQHRSTPVILSVMPVNRPHMPDESRGYVDAKKYSELTGVDFLNKQGI
jgi:hypothetical protein